MALATDFLIFVFSELLRPCSYAALATELLICCSSEAVQLWGSGDRLFDSVIFVDFWVPCSYRAQATDFLICSVLGPCSYAALATDLLTLYFVGVLQLRALATDFLLNY